MRLRRKKNTGRRMTVYVIAQLKFKDEERYRKYQARFFDVFKDSGGRLLAADEKPVVLDGEWERDKVVVMSFADEQKARSFLDSPGYREISKDRIAGADTVGLLVHGLPSPA
jgi:uncharacterized protein (DUF1330 family)